MISMGRAVFTLLFFLLANGAWQLELVHADLSSPSYKISREWISGGGGEEVSSSSFKVLEGSIDSAAQALMSGTSYRIQSQIGLKDGIPPMPPQIDAVSPGNLSRFFMDETASYTVQATDPTGENLEYQLKAGQTVKTLWQASPALSYGLTAQDKGRHRLSFEVRNSEGTTVMAQDQYIFRRPAR